MDKIDQMNLHLEKTAMHHNGGHDWTLARNLAAVEVAVVILQEAGWAIDDGDMDGAIEMSSFGGTVIVVHPEGR